MDGVKDEVRDVTTWDDLSGFLRNEDLRIPQLLFLAKLVVVDRVVG